MNELKNEFEIDLRDYFRVLWKRKWVIISFMFITLISAYFVVNRMSPVYKSTTTVMVQDNDGMDNFFGSDIFSMGKDLVGTYSRMIKTRGFLEEVIRRVDLRDKNNNPMRVSQLNSIIEINNIIGTDLIEISIEHTDPYKTQEILTTLVELFQDKNTEMNKAALSGTREFVQKQLIEVKQSLEKAENDLLDYKQTNQVVLPSEEAVQFVKKLTEIESLREMTIVEQKSLDSTIRWIEGELANQDETVVSAIVLTSNALIKQYKGQLVELEGQLAGLKMKFTSNHAEVIALEQQIANLKKALSEEVEQEIYSQTKSVNPVYQALYGDLIKLQTNWLANQAKIEGYDKLVAEYSNDLQSLPEKELGLARLERNAKVSNEIYTMLMTRLEEIKISESMQTSNIYPVDPPYLPTNPVKPNKKVLIAFAGVLAVFFSMVIVLGIEYMDNSVKTPEDIEKLLDLPVLGSIPDMKRFKKQLPSSKEWK